jgi:hypothetical protein
MNPENCMTDSLSLKKMPEIPDLGNPAFYCILAGLRKQSCLDAVIMSV